jgi:hypothetical protein
MIKRALLEVATNTGHIAVIAGVGGIANFVVHHYTENHYLNAAAMMFATGAAASLRRKT